MRAALFLAPSLLPATPSKNLSDPLALPSKPSSSVSSRVSPAKASWATYEATTVVSSPAISVFPAEACKTIVGEPRLADIYPKGINAAMQATEAVEREYPEYTVRKWFFQKRFAMISAACFHTREVFTRINQGGQTQQQKRDFLNVICI